jgi:hypothetical protein
MTKTEWLLLDEQARVLQLSNWLSRLIELDNAVPSQEQLQEKRKLEKTIMNIFDWVKDYE